MIRDPEPSSALNPSFRWDGLRLLVVVAVVFLGAACNSQSLDNGYRRATVVLAGKQIDVDIADTATKQELGLGGRNSITDNQGMLFPFSPAKRPVFWMKGMKFAIDIVWIRDNKVVDITRDAEPQPGAADSRLRLFVPVTQVDNVLELRAGWANKYGLKIGDLVKVNLKQNKS